MRDILLIYDEKGAIDIDIVNGEPVYVREEQNTWDQRAAVGAYLSKGTIPGMLDIGVDWPALHAQRDSLVDVDNQIKQQINSFAVTPNEKASTYTPIYRTRDGQLDVSVVRTDM